MDAVYRPRVVRLDEESRGYTHPMRKYRFVQVDVFTNRPFGGNQLAVFPEAEGIADTEMQAIAREMNFSETTFVLPPTDPDHDARVRIFTPGIIFFNKVQHNLFYIFYKWFVKIFKCHF